MLAFHPSVRFSSIEDPTVTMFRYAALWALRAGETVMVYSAEDKTHNAGSLHPYGLALDFDVIGNDPAKLELLYEFLRRWMPPGFDVVFEGNHVHVEYDVKRAPMRTVPRLAGFAPAAPAAAAGNPPLEE